MKKLAPVRVMPRVFVLAVVALGCGDSGVVDAAADTGIDAPPARDSAADGAADGRPPPDGSVVGPEGYQGFGRVSAGGEGGDLCVVDNLDDDGPGSFRDCVTNRSGPRTVEFSVGGTITLLSDVVINRPFLTIDGSTAPVPGITIDKAVVTEGAVIITSNARGLAHDIIIGHLRFDGGWDRVSEDSGNNEGTIAIDGENVPEGVFNVILDHIVVTGATDSGGDMWGEVHDVTVSNSMFLHSHHPMTISHDTATMTRQRISLHHNLFAYNHERNPQVRGLVRDLDYVNNIVFEWKLFPGGYGVRIRERLGVWPSGINIVNNFFHGTMAPDSAVLFEPADFPGDVYASGNWLQTLSDADISTVSDPIEVPPTSRVTTFDVAELATDVLPFVGMPDNRTVEEQAVIDEVRAALASR